MRMHSVGLTCGKGVSMCLVGQVGLFFFEYFLIDKCNFSLKMMVFIYFTCKHQFIYSKFDVAIITGGSTKLKRPTSYEDL